jgi:hypothetical protein
MAASTPTSGLNPSIRLWLVRALFFISFVECAQAWPWPAQTKQPLQFISPNSHTQNLPIIGIHIGQNLTRAAVIYNQTISLIPFEHGILSMPNIVSFVSNPPLVGHEVTKANATHNVYGIELSHTKRPTFLLLKHEGLYVDVTHPPRSKRSVEMK